MDYFIKKAVERVRERRRSREEVKRENSVDESEFCDCSLHSPSLGQKGCIVLAFLPNQYANTRSSDLQIAAKNSIANMDLARHDSISSDTSDDHHLATRSVTKEVTLRLLHRTMVHTHDINTW